MPINLSIEKQEPTKHWRQQKFLMLGAGKIGKSEFWAQGANTLFIETEPGLNHLKCMKVSVRCWDDMRTIAGELLRAKDDLRFDGTLVDTIAIDTVDRLVDFSNEDVISRGQDKYPKSKIEAIGDVPNGAGWYWSTTNIQNCISKLQELGVALALISHVKPQEIEEPTRKYTKHTISIGGQTGTKLIHWADHTIFVEARLVGDRKERTLHTKPTQTMEAGSRGNVIPDGLKWGDDARANYEAFRKLFT